MRLSRYTRLIPIDRERVILFNGLTGALAVAGRAEVGSLAADGRNGEGGGASFVVEEGVDEREVYRHAWYRAQHSAATLCVTICPTMACDMDCVYCFLARDNGPPMSRDVADAVLRATAALADRSQTLEVTWFGGEPLLAVECIEYLSRRLADIAAGAGCRYHASMFTNAYGLSPDVARLLRELGVDNIAVPLDGPAPVHERRRPRRDGRPCFDRIIGNAGAAAALLDVTVQCSVDETNYDDAWALYDWLNSAGYLGRVNFRIGPAQCRLNAQERRPRGLLTPAAFDRRLMAALRQRRGCPRLRPPFPALHLGCTYQRFNTLTVDARGHLYRCLRAVGRPALAIGHISSPPDLASSALAPWLRLDPLRRERCRACPVVPMCGGGCAQKFVADGVSECSRWRFTLDDWLRLIVELQGGT